jgi:hypothetical protein
MTTAAVTLRRPALAVPGSFRKWGVFEWYVIVLFLASGLVFVPGTQPLRPVIRALPYAFSFATLLWYISARSRRSISPAGRWVAPALILYAVNVFHPLTHPVVGVATVAFHLSIVAPVFWADASVRGHRHFEFLLGMIWAAAMANVVMGILQAAFPYIFMPPSLAGVEAVIAQQTYMGPFGHMIVRPPGLSDLPGGASSAGAVVTILGLAMAVRDGSSSWLRGVGFLSVGAGLFVLYLTQVRAFMLMTAVAIILFAVLSFLQGRGRGFLTWSAGTLLLALLIGGLQMPTYDPSNPYAPGNRFYELLERGLFTAFMENRGFFLVRTFNEHLLKYPLGAGLGRWGMVREYFGRGTPFSQIWVEIQPTGWLLDGGVLMWIFYGGALIAAMGYSLHLALQPRSRELAHLAAVVLGLQLVIAGSGLAGPVFNTGFGILFWLLTGALHTVARSAPPRARPAHTRDAEPHASLAS